MSSGQRSRLGFPLDDPFRHHLAGAAAARDAVGEAGRDEDIVELGRLAHDESPSAEKRDRSVDELADADLLDHRRALERGLGQHLEALEIALEQLLTELPAECRPRRRRGVPSSQPPITMPRTSGL